MDKEIFRMKQVTIKPPCPPGPVGITATKTKTSEGRVSIVIKATNSVAMGRIEINNETLRGVDDSRTGDINETAMAISAILLEIIKEPCELDE